MRGGGAKLASGCAGWPTTAPISRKSCRSRSASKSSGQRPARTMGSDSTAPTEVRTALR